MSCNAEYTEEEFATNVVVDNFIDSSLANRHNRSGRWDSYGSPTKEGLQGFKIDESS